MGKASGRGINKQGRSEVDSAFVKFPWWLIESPAFHAVSPDTKVTLFYMTKRFNGRNNGEIVFGVRSGGRVRNPGQPDAATKDCPIMSRPRLQAALQEAIAFKLVEVTKESSYGQKKIAREWRLTWLPCAGKIATKEFMALTAADCTRILDCRREEKTKARHARVTRKPKLGTPACQAGGQIGQYIAIQSRPRDANAIPQSRPHDTSSNHPIGDSDALSEARAILERRAIAASMERPSARRFGARQVREGAQ